MRLQVKALAAFVERNEPHLTSFDMPNEAFKTYALLKTKGSQFSEDIKCLCGTYRSVDQSAPRSNPERTAAKSFGCTMVRYD